MASGIDAPELDQTFWWRRQQIAWGAMSLAALEALIAGVKFRRERSSGTGAADLSPRCPRPTEWTSAAACSAGWALAYRRYSKDYVDPENEVAEQGERRKAHDLLAPVYGWFTEGFETADFKDAKALLDELA
jgi:endonuclease YncB( thermonuclease family)